MFGRLFQRSMIALARSPRVTRFMHGYRPARRVARKFVAGTEAADAARFARSRFEEFGIRTSLYYLGEYVDSSELVRENVEAKLAAVHALADRDLDLHVSVDPTQIGYVLSEQIATRNARTIASAIRTAADERGGIHQLMLDMEDQSLVPYTIALHDELQDDGLPVALTLQAYLRRTRGDLSARIRRASRIRLVKGSFAAGPEVAYTNRDRIRRNYRDLLEIMFSREAMETGFYPIVATHDEFLLRFAGSLAARNGWSSDDFEFELLLGVRPTLERNLCAEGNRVRLYMPFGSQWWPYTARRIGEAPRNAMFVASAVASRSK